MTDRRRIAEVLKLCGMTEENIELAFNNKINVVFIGADISPTGTKELTVFEGVPSLTVNKDSSVWVVATESNGDDKYIYIPSTLEKLLGIDLKYNQLYIYSDVDIPNRIIELNNNTARFTVVTKAVKPMKKMKKKISKIEMFINSSLVKLEDDVNAYLKKYSVDEYNINIQQSSAYDAANENLYVTAMVHITPKV